MSSCMRQRRGSRPASASARTRKGDRTLRLFSTATISSCGASRSTASTFDPAAGFVTPNQLTIAAPPKGPFTLEIDTEINPSANTRLMGLYRSGSAYCTQCEAEGFRRITYFLDRPDVLSVYTVRLEAEIAEAPLLLSNGNKIGEGRIEGDVAAFRALA